MTIKAVILINERMKEAELKSKLVMTVHDSIVADVYIPEFEEVHYIMKDTMENLPFDWITVPIVADMEVGMNYGTLFEYDSPDVFKEYGGAREFVQHMIDETNKEVVES